MPNKLQKWNPAAFMYSIIKSILGLPNLVREDMAAEIVKPLKEGTIPSISNVIVGKREPANGRS